jgi:hypothetical protein
VEVEVGAEMHREILLEKRVFDEEAETMVEVAVGVASKKKVFEEEEVFQVLD